MSESGFIQARTFTFTHKMIAFHFWKLFLWILIISALCAVLIVLLKDKGIIMTKGRKAHSQKGKSQRMKDKVQTREILDQEEVQTESVSSLAIEHKSTVTRQTICSTTQMDGQKNLSDLDDENGNSNSVLENYEIVVSPTYNCRPLTTGEKEVTLLSENGEVYFTFRDTPPQLFKEPIIIDSNGTLNYWRVKNGLESKKESVTFADFEAKPPVISIDNNILEIKAEDKSKIYFTLDNTTPSHNSQLFVRPIALNKSCVIKAIAVAEHKRSSVIISVRFCYVPTDEERIRELTVSQNVMGISFQGDGHIKQSLPCQDFHSFSELPYNWKLAIVSDGAGSAKLSDSGSKAVCAGFKYYIENLIKESNSLQNGEILDAPIWNMVFRSMLSSFQAQLKALARNNKCEYKDLSATIILLLYNDNGYMSAHLGDGRGGVKVNGEWRELFTPHKGEEANQTFFSTVDISNSSLMANGIPVPETSVFRQKIDGYVLMSDGCENGCWTTYQRVDLPNGEWRVQDVNKPRIQVLESLLSVLKVSDKQALVAFVKDFNEKLKTETDDKTILIGVL